ncbi:hypothetical protein ACOSQ4_010051 [Xanthoceras sorbifolium]
MTSMGYKQSQGDHTLLVKHSSSGGVTALQVYIDVIIVIRDDVKEKEELNQCLPKNLRLKDLGRLNYRLGIKVTHYQWHLCFQQKYVINLLQEIGTLGCKPIDTPVEPN